jgi:hypothetical protein
MPCIGWAWEHAFVASGTVCAWAVAAPASTLLGAQLVPHKDILCKLPHLRPVRCGEFPALDNGNLLPAGFNDSCVLSMAVWRPPPPPYCSMVPTLMPTSGP